jgi:hypothetical protein
MRPPDATPNEMPGIPFPGRPGGEHDEPLLDMLFGVRVLPPDAPPEMHDLARTLAALAGPADPSELAGEAAALAAFTKYASPAGLSPRSPAPGPARHRRPAGRRTVRRARLATALLGAAAMIVSIAAAYTGALPEPIQRVAHLTINAPPPAVSHPAPKQREHDQSSPAARPGSQPAPPPARPAVSASGAAAGSTTGSVPTMPGSTSHLACGPGPWQPQSLPSFLRSALPKVTCPPSATPTPAAKATAKPSPSKSAMATAKATPGWSG